MQVLKQSEAALPLLRTHGERPIVDLQDLPESTQNARALEAYDRISTGDALEIVSTHRPSHLFAEFRARYGSAFYWWPLESRPGVWRVMVAKPAPEPATTIAGVMGSDHHRLHDLSRDFVRGVEICRIDDLSRCLGEFALGLHRHIAIEEAMLFPLLEAQTEMKARDQPA